MTRRFTVGHLGGIPLKLAIVPARLGLLVRELLARFGY